MKVFQPKITTALKGYKKEQIIKDINDAYLGKV